MTELKVIPIGVVPNAAPKPNEGIIRVLRECLKEAKAGKIQGLAIAMAVYNPDSLENKQSTENNICNSDGYDYATRVALHNLCLRIDRIIESYSVQTEVSPLTEEDE